MDTNFIQYIIYLFIMVVDKTSLPRFPKTATLIILILI